MSYVAIREITISGRSYAPGDIVKLTGIEPRLMSALIEHRRIAPMANSESDAPKPRYARTRR